MVELFLSKLGAKQWFLGSSWHRANGPAVLWADGHCEWYWYDDRVTEFEHMMLVAHEKEYG